MNKMIRREIVNTGRQREVDLLKGLTALNIIECHTNLYLGNNISEGMYTFADIFGSEFGAPMFMAAMGINMTYSRKQSSMEMFVRGLKMLIIAYALSFFRSILPLMLLGNIDEWTSIDAFFVIDIMQFAGLAFIFTALLKKLKIGSIGMFLISIGMVIANQFIMLPEVAWDNAVLTGVVNLFTPTTDWSCFPFLTWYFFVAFGYVFGDKILKHCDDKDKLYGILLPVSLVGVLFVYWQFYKLYPNYTSYYYGNNFYFMGLENVLLTSLFICFALSFWHFVGKMLPKKAESFLTYLSKNLNTFYIMSWIAISVLIHLQALYGWSYNTLDSIILMIAITLTCLVNTSTYNKFKKL